MSKVIYKIEILSWEKHNRKSKPHLPYIMLSKRFFDDAKVQMLPAGGKLLLLGLMLRRGDVDQTFIEASHEDLVRLAGGSGQVVQRLLDQLQSFQLLTYEKNTSNIKEIKVKEIKVIENKLPAPIKKTKPSNEDTENNRKIWESYSNAFRLRYRIEPVRNATVNAQISSLRKKLGTEDAINVAKFYLTHNEGFYLKKTHEFGLCLKDAETLRTQMLRGRTITSNDVRNFEKQDSFNSAMRQIESESSGE